MIGMASAKRGVSACLLLMAPGLATAQSLGDAAKREAERREKNRVEGVQAKAYTEDDLANANGWVSQPGTALYDEWLRTRMPGNAGRNSETAWRNRTARLRENVSQADARLKAAESEAAGVGPIGLKRQILEMKGGAWAADAEAARAQMKVDAARSSAEQARKALEALDDEARRKGAPPGWVR
jgi:hypothetical protein